MAQPVALAPRTARCSCAFHCTASGVLHRRRQSWRNLFSLVPLAQASCSQCLDPPSLHCRFRLSVGACHVVFTSCKRKKEAKRRSPLYGFSDPHDHSVRRQLLLRLRAASISIAARASALMIAALLPQAAHARSQYSCASLWAGLPHRLSIVRPGSGCSSAFVSRSMSQARGRRTPPASRSLSIAFMCHARTNRTYPFSVWAHL